MGDFFDYQPPVFVSGATAGYIFPERLWAALSEQVGLAPLKLEFDQALHQVSTASLGEHRRVRIVRDLVWREPERRRAGYEMFKCLVLERDEELSERWENLLPCLRWIDPAFQGATREWDKTPTLTTFMRMVVRNGAFGVERADPNKQRLKAEERRQARARLWPKSAESRLSLEEMDDAVASDRERIARRLAVTRVCCEQLEPFGYAWEQRLTLAQAMAGLLLTNGSTGERWKHLMPLDSRRADAANAIGLLTSIDSQSPDTDRADAALLIALLGRLDPRFLHLEADAISGVLGQIRTQADHKLKPTMALAQLVVCLRDRPLELHGDASQVRHLLTQGARVDEE